MMQAEDTQDIRLMLYQDVKMSAEDTGDIVCRMSRDKVKHGVFEIHVDTWVYSKEDTMAHTRMPVVIS